MKKNENNKPKNNEKIKKDMNENLPRKMEIKEKCTICIVYFFYYVL